MRPMPQWHTIRYPHMYTSHNILHTRYSSVRPMSRIDLQPAHTTATGVRPSSVKSALTSKPAERKEEEEHKNVIQQEQKKQEKLLTTCTTWKLVRGWGSAIVQLQQMKSGIITWVCTNSLTAPDVLCDYKSCVCMPNWLNNLEPVTSHPEIKGAAQSDHSQFHLPQL